MGYLAHTKCYLVGPIEHDKSFGMDWRQAAVKELNDLGVTIYNPLDRPVWMEHIAPYIPMAVSRDEVLEKIEASDSESTKYVLAQEFVRRICLRYIHSCDFVLCYLLNAKTFGTTEELVVAHQARKPVIMICPDNIPSLWIYDLVKDQYIFKNLRESLSFLNEINDGIAKLEILKWIFIKDYPNFELEKRYDW